MQFGYITNGFSHHRLEDALEVLADLGYRSVGITLDVNHLDPMTCTPAEVARIAKQLVRLRLQPTIETGGRYVLDPWRKHQPNLCSATPAERRRRVDFYARAAAIGADLGAQVVSLWSGALAAGGRGEPGRRRPAKVVFDDLRAGLSATCERVARRGLVVGFEPEPGMLIATLGDFDRLSAALDHPALRLTLDIGHLHCLGETNYAAIFQRYHERLVNVHLEDMRAGVHEHRMFGEGEMRFGPILRALAAAGYTGPINVELSRHSVTAVETARAALRFLQKAAPGKVPAPR